MLDTSPTVVAALLPERRALCGPVTRRRLARLALIYAGVFALGLLLAYGASTPRWQAFGFGLMLPGGGFLANAGDTAHGLVHLGIGLAALAAFAAAIFAWFATGNAITPPALWFLFAALAALMDHGAIPHHAAVLPLGIGGLAAVGGLVVWAKRVRQRARRAEANRHLEKAGPRPEPVAHDRQSELSAQDVQLMRFVLDRALQPLEAFDGFEWLDQFQTAAVRYQLNFLGFALSMAQATHLPAFGGYLTTAQRRLIDKLADHRVWRYWALENCWGNLALDPDPVARENIMFTGFCATQMAMYHAASGRRDFDRPGSFALIHPDGRRYDYDLGALVEALEREQKRSAFALIACEPNWIYPLCNTIGAAAMTAHDRMHARSLWPTHAARFRASLEAEFIDLAGRIVPCRSNYTGLSLPMIGGAQPQAMPCFFLNATLPDVALRQWLLLRRELLTRAGQLDRRKFWRIDTGNYRASRAAAYTGTALAAVELGDREVWRACLAALDAECPARADREGGWFRPDASVWAHAVELFARSGKANGFRRLIENPRAGESMRIDDAAYPDVLVANAVESDGMLRAVLYPGARGSRQPLGFSGLVPEARYACDGLEETELAADGKGAARAHVVLTGRAEIRLRPMV